MAATMGFLESARRFNISCPFLLNAIKSSFFADFTSLMSQSGLVDFGWRFASAKQTWVAWIDDICQGDIRFQRIEPSGSVMAPVGLILPMRFELCGNMDMMLASLVDGSVIVHAAMPNTGMPLHRIAPDGTLLWGKGLMAPWLGRLRAALGLPDGSVLLGGNAGASMIVSRQAVDGTTMWMTEIPTNHTSNIRVLGLVPDNDGGAFLVWDKPLTYTRMILAAHVTEAGIASWSEPLVVVPPDPSSSRHTEPVVIADGLGGVVVVFTKGSETAHAPVPLLMQHFDVKGELTFTPQGARVSLDTERQYNAIVMHDDDTNDITIVYRSGPFADQVLRAQRMTLDGERLWGDTGPYAPRVS